MKIDRQADVPTPTGIAGNSLYPAFSLFKGWENEGEEDHQYNTLGNTPWAKDISYLAHEANQNGALSVLDSFVLPAGRYSLAIGGNPSDPTLMGRHGYTATLTTTSVPEPAATTGLLAVAAVAIVGFFPRRKAHIN